METSGEGDRGSRPQLEALQKFPSLFLSFPIARRSRRPSSGSSAIERQSWRVLASEPLGPKRRTIFDSGRNFDSLPNAVQYLRGGSRARKANTVHACLRRGAALVDVEDQGAQFPARETRGGNKVEEDETQGSR